MNLKLKTFYIANIPEAIHQWNFFLTQKESP